MNDDKYLNYPLEEDIGESITEEDITKAFDDYINDTAPDYFAMRDNLPENASDEEYDHLNDLAILQTAIDEVNEDRSDWSEEDWEEFYKDPEEENNNP